MDQVLDDDNLRFSHLFKHRNQRYTAAGGKSRCAKGSYSELAAWIPGILVWIDTAH